MSSSKKNSRSPTSQAARASAEYGQARRTRVSPETQEMIDVSNEYIEVATQFMNKIADKINRITTSRKTSPQSTSTLKKLTKQFIRLNQDIDLFDEAVDNFKRESLTSVPKERRVTALRTQREFVFRRNKRDFEDIMEEDENPVRGAGTVLRPASPRRSSSPK